MNPALAFAFLAASAVLVGLVALLSWWLSRNATSDRAHDDLKRAGDVSSADSQAAALRAGGSTAWTRIGGGGL